MIERFRVVSWEEGGTPTEEKLCDLLTQEGYKTRHWSKNAGHVSEFHTHPFDKVVYVLQGKIIYSLPESGRSVKLRAGDRLELPAWTTHHVMAGPEGVQCIEGRFSSN